MRSLFLARIEFMSQNTSGVSIYGFSRISVESIPSPVYEILRQFLVEGEVFLVQGGNTEHDVVDVARRRFCQPLAARRRVTTL